MSNRSRFIEIYGKEHTGKINTYRVLPDLKVDVLLEKIQEDTEIPMKNLQVTFIGETLGYHWDRVLSDYRIRNYSTLSIRDTFRWEIIVKEMTGKKTTYFVEPDMDVDELYDEIASRNKFPTEDFSIFFKGQRVFYTGRDDPCLSDFGIKDQSTIHLMEHSSESWNLTTEQDYQVKFR